MTENDLSKILSTGLTQLKLEQPVDENQQATLIKYVQLLDKWNKAYNLTAIRDPKQMVTRHILDSIAICPYLRGKRVLDVGTGAGLPGIVLAVLFPERHFTLLDSNNKKTRFVTQAASELELTNISVVQSRVENFQAPVLFNTITTRAYSAIGTMIRQTSHLLAENGVFLAMKGTNPVAEIEDLPSNYKVEKNHIISVPGLDEERHLLEIRIVK